MYCIGKACRYAYLRDNRNSSRYTLEFNVYYVSLSINRSDWLAHLVYFPCLVNTCPRIPVYWFLHQHKHHRPCLNRRSSEASLAPCDTKGQGGSRAKQKKFYSSTRHVNPRANSTPHYHLFLKIRRSTDDLRKITEDITRSPGTLTPNHEFEFKARGLRDMRDKMATFFEQVPDFKRKVKEPRKLSWSSARFIESN